MCPLPDNNFLQVWSNVRATGDAELVCGSHTFPCNVCGTDGSAVPGCTGARLNRSSWPFHHSKLPFSSGAPRAHSEGNGPFPSRDISLHRKRECLYRFPKIPLLSSVEFSNEYVIVSLQGKSNLTPANCHSAQSATPAGDRFPPHKRAIPA